MPDGLICPARPIIDGDALSMSIAAASIVAKTMRDALMRNLGRDYPQYGFAEHVGYATVGHRRALASAGPCPYHRRSFRLERETKNEFAVQKGFKKVEIEYRLERLTPYENDTAECAAA